jgi:hypothetical protein
MLPHIAIYSTDLATALTCRGDPSAATRTGLSTLVGRRSVEVAAFPQAVLEISRYVEDRLTQCNFFTRI